MRILIINGPNLNLLGLREPEIYGSGTYEELESYIQQQAEIYNIQTTLFQSNQEGLIIDAIQGALGKQDGIILNAAAYTHTSIGILDALLAVSLPVVEVHLTDLSNRESFRQHSYPSLVAKKTYMGLGWEGYKKALEFFINHT